MNEKVLARGTTTANHAWIVQKCSRRGLTGRTSAHSPPSRPARQQPCWIWPEPRARAKSQAGTAGEPRLAHGGTTLWRLAQPCPRLSCLLIVNGALHRNHEEISGRILGIVIPFANVVHSNSSEE